jgi:integrase
MPTKRLTDLFVERVKPPARGRIEYFDAAFGGLALRVTDKGHKSWSLHYRIGGRQRRFTIGSYPAIKPAEARRDAGRALDRVRQGFDPAEDKRAHRLVTPHQGVAEVVRDYLDRVQRNAAPNTYRVTKHTFESDVLPIWQNRLIHTITRGDVHRVIDAILARRADVHANRVLARLRTFFNWTVERDQISASPVAGMKPPTKERPRDRVLSDDELRWLWRASDIGEWPFGSLVKLLLLTAQRRDEVARMEWPEVNFEKRNWTQPREKTKNDQAHDVQLSAPVIETLNSIPRIGKGFIFTSNGEAPVSGFSYAKMRLDAAMLEAKREELGDKCEAIPHWTLHDLRRTAATGMARLNFPPHVVDKILNHRSGTIRGVAAIYNKYAYAEERRAALEAWGRYVTSLLDQPRSNIFALSTYR